MKKNTTNPLAYAEEKAKDQCPLTYKEMQKLIDYLEEEDDDKKWDRANRLHLIPDEEWMESEALYHLWTMRNSFTHVPYKVLFAIVGELLNGIDHAESSANWAGYDGR